MEPPDIDSPRKVDHGPLPAPARSGRGPRDDAHVEFELEGEGEVETLYASEDDISRKTRFLTTFQT